MGTNQSSFFRLRAAGSTRTVRDARTSVRDDRGLRSEVELLLKADAADRGNGIPQGRVFREPVQAPARR